MGAELARATSEHWCRAAPAGHGPRHVDVTRLAAAGARGGEHLSGRRCPGITPVPRRLPTPAVRRRAWKELARAAAAAVALAAVVAAVVTGWPALTESVALLGHRHGIWIWILVAAAGEAGSVAAFAVMFRKLLTAGGARIGIRPMLATTYAANALSVSVPIAGSWLGTAYTFRRFTGQGADAPLAGWALLAGGMASFAAAALVLAGGALSSGNIVIAAVAAPGGVLAVAAMAAAGAAVRRPRLRGALKRPIAWTLQRGSRLSLRLASSLQRAPQGSAERLGSLRLPPSGWMMVTALAMANWLADASVLAVSIQAAGATVPWHFLLLIYGSGVAAQSVNLTPGGLGLTEGTLGLTLIASGLHASQALAAVLLYRLASFWLVASAGWLVLLWLRRRPSRPS